MKKIIGTVAIALLGLVVLAGCGKSSDNADKYLNEIKEQKTLKVAMSADFPPFEFQILKNGQNTIVGSDVDIANAIAKELGVKLELQNMDFNTVLTALQSGKADIAISGISARPDRKKTFDFSDTYYESIQKVVIRKKDAATYTTVASVAGKKIGAQQGSIQADVVKDQLPKANGVNMDTIPNLVNATKGGQIEGFVVEEAIGKSYISANPDLVFAKIPLKSSSEDAYAVAMPKNAGKLKTEINTVIEKLQKEGKIDKFVSDSFKLAQENSKK
jgi:polar amino acid transport system substrate-binding protein